ncbi:uncharacterized protein LOC126273021 [Schistocerca gregaria]|uniref:uncharacterized protein LOC126273021 n=1 Tax=Schistocerca gregaria TaxID=7010 RepID=UPI00211EA89A|nr:uncharacterized protein LOC126273021 [Schistocerca gregaria]
MAYIRCQCSDFLVPFFPLPYANDSFHLEALNGENFQEDIPAITYRIIDFIKLQAGLQETSGIRRKKQRKHRSIPSKQASEGSTATLLILLSELFNEVEEEYSTKDCPCKRKRLV